MQGGERYNSINNYLKNYFGEKTIKLSIDAGFTCPNRDGSLGYGGCMFCSANGSGDLASKYSSGKISLAINEQIKNYQEKWPRSKYLAYFQAYSNTYGPIEELKQKYYEAINDPNISGIVIATRPDCINNEIVNLLKEINSANFLWVELGLQTIHKQTSKAMNLYYDVNDYDRAIDLLLSANIKVVTHIILGLPGETTIDMLETVKYVCKKNIFGIKLHLMNLVKTSTLYNKNPNYISFKTMDEYIDLIIQCLEIIPPEITIHRLTGDVPRKILVSPEWSYKKRTILNKINLELRKRNTYQGKLSCR